MNKRSLELRHGIGTTSSDHLDVKFEVQNNTERDLLITEKSIKKGHIIYHLNDNCHYFLDTYPTPGSLVGVKWEFVGAKRSNSLDLDSEDTVLTSKGAKELKTLIDNISFLDPNNPPIFIDGSDADGFKDSIRFTFSHGDIVDVSIKDLVDLGAFNNVTKSGETITTLDFSTLGGDLISIDLSSWFNLKLGKTEIAVDSLKLGGQLPSYYSTYNSLILGLDSKENAFSKNTAFNKNFGVTSGTVAEGNDIRISHGETAYNKKVNSISFSGNTNKTLTLTLQDGSTLVASFTDIDTNTDIYLDNISFNPSTGIFSATLTDLEIPATTSLDGRWSLLGHLHDDRYYTESEIDSKLLLKYDSNNFGKTEIEGLGLDYTSLSNRPVLYTSSDFNFDFGNKTTSNLVEGDNLYFTSTRVTNMVTKVYVDSLGINATYLGGNLPSYYASVSSLRNLETHDLTINVSLRTLNLNSNSFLIDNIETFTLNGNSFNSSFSTINLEGSTSITVGNSTGNLTINSTGVLLKSIPSSSGSLKIESNNDIVLKTFNSNHVFVDTQLGLYSKYIKVGTPLGFSGVLSSTGITSDRSLLIPDNSGTLALRDVDNQFSALQNFNANILIGELQLGGDDLFENEYGIIYSADETCIASYYYGTITPYLAYGGSSTNPAIKILVSNKFVYISNDLTVSGNLTSTNFIKSGGTSSQFLKADGSVDSTSYIPSSEALTYIEKSKYVVDEIPSGDIDGINDTFYLSNTPIIGKLMFFINGLKMEAGELSDYTITGNIITINLEAIPVEGDKLSVTYIY